MGREKFNILHPLFWEALDEVTGCLRREGIDQAIVGGAAAQIWIAALLTGGKRSIDAEPELPLRLRTTRDLDISTLTSSERMLPLLNAVAASSRPPVEVLSARAVRLRGVHVNLTLAPGDVTGFSRLYEGILRGAQELILRRGARTLVVRAESLAHLLGTKLTSKGSQQSKDLLDVDAICRCLSERGGHLENPRAPRTGCGRDHAAGNVSAALPRGVQVVGEHPADRFLAEVERLRVSLEGRDYAFSGDTARCLWMLHGIPGGSLELWKRICQPWPGQLELLPTPNGDPVVREFGPTMLRVTVELPGLKGPVPLAPPEFVLAQLLVEEDPLAVTRVADLLRCLDRERLDLEDVRTLLKAVCSGDRFETLQSIDYVL